MTSSAAPPAAAPTLEQLTDERHALANLVQCQLYGFAPVEGLAENERRLAALDLELSHRRRVAVRFAHPSPLSEVA